MPTLTAPPPVTRREICALLGLLAGVFATRLPFVMHGLDEWDSVNFALSVVRFDVLRDQPHPPGQYVYVRLMQGLNALCGSHELFALSLGSVLGSTLLLVPYYFAVRQVFRPAVALGASVLTAFTFGFWVTSLRMISDPVAGLFVYGTVCLLLLGLTDRRWFVLGMALCGLTLGVKQTAVYFLAPFALAVNGWVLWRHGPRRPLLGSGVFALVVAAWLLPTVGNAHGWSHYLAACRATQTYNYAVESTIFHLSAETLAAQTQNDLLSPWGGTAQAVATLTLAAAGLVLCLRRGRRGVLFGLFGASVVLYAFFFLNRFHKYYAYSVPFYCALAAAALFAAGEFLAARTRRPLARWLVPGAGIALLALAGVVRTAPLLPRIAHFRAPPQAALEALRRLPEAGSAPLLLTDDKATGHELRYFYFKGQVDLLNRHADLRAAADALNAGRKVYLLSPVDFDTGTEPPGSIRLVGTYEWPTALSGPLQARPDLRRLMLYELHAPLPTDYDFQAGTRPPLLFTGMGEDGWCEPDVSLVLPCSGQEGGHLHLRLTVPPDPGYRYPYGLTCQFDDGSQATLTVDHAGPADLIVPLPGRADARAVEMRLVAAQSFQFTPDNGDNAYNRKLAVHLEEVDTVSSSQPLRFRLRDGWYPEESNDHGRWRWARGDASLSVLTNGAGTLAVDGGLISSSGDNAVELLVDGQPAGEVPASATAWSALSFRVPLAAGFHLLTFHSRHPGSQVPGDGRTLAFRVRELRMHLE